MQNMAQSNTIFSFVQLLRVPHWLKNLYVFVPVFFAGEIMNAEVLTESLIAFSSFCLVASSIYIINDFKDRKEDQLHPEKQNRPLASGAINPAFALGISGLLAVMSFAIAWMGNIYLLEVIGAYFIINLAYSLALKHVALVDITIIAIGFLLRVFAGGVVSDIPISYWLVIMIFLLSLFMGFAKRRDDVLLHQNQKIKARKNIEDYSQSFIEISMSVMAAVIIVAYIMYTVSPEIRERTGSDYVYITSFFVVLGMLRYLQRTLGQSLEGSPVKVLLTDRHMQVILIAWVVSFFAILYGF